MQIVIFRFPSMNFKENHSKYLLPIDGHNLIIEMQRIFTILIGVLILNSCNHKKSETPKILDTDIKEISIPKYSPANQVLFDTIIALDKMYWNAYNKGDANTIIDFMTDDHEFYHDEEGILFTKAKNEIEWRKFFSMNLGVIGETVEGTNEIYEIADYGALQIFYQRFYDKRNPEWSKPVRAVTLWKKTPKGWLQSRVFSLH